MSGGTLERKLSRFLLSYRTTPNTSTGAIPAEMLVKRKLQTNLDRLMPSTSTTVLLSQDHLKFHHDRTAKMQMFHKARRFLPRTLTVAPDGWLAGHVLEGIDALSFLIKLRDGWVIRRHQDLMRARLCSSEPMSPTPVNNPRPEQIESRLQPQLGTAPRIPIPTPDTVIPENPPVQKSTVAKSTPPRRSALEIRAPERFSPAKSLYLKQGLKNKWGRGDVMYEKLGSYSLWGSTGNFRRWALKASLKWINRGYDAHKYFLLIILQVIL